MIGYHFIGANAELHALMLDTAAFSKHPMPDKQKLPAPSVRRRSKEKQRRARRIK
jgi:hypothetical protein